MTLKPARCLGVCHIGGHCDPPCCKDCGQIRSEFQGPKAKVGIRVAVFSKDLKEFLGEGIIKEVKIPDIGEVGEFDFEPCPSKIGLDDGRVVNGREFKWSPI